jgi:hypothetical protein
VIGAAIPPCRSLDSTRQPLAAGHFVFPVEESCFMLALQLRLDFSCCVCAHVVLLTLKCEGPGLADNPQARVTVECPTCNGSNRIWFSPEDGRVHRVTRDREYDGIAEPSCN